MTRVILPVLMLAISGLSAHAGVQSCVNINGMENCATAMRSLNCQTIDGKTTCIADGVQRYSETTTTTAHTKTPWTDADVAKALAAAGVKLGPNGSVHVKTGGAQVDVGDDD